MDEISIGANAFVGGDCRIYDTDFHPVAYRDRVLNDQASVRHAPVVIEEGVFVGASCIILKGVRIGRRSIVGAGSVVARDIPAFQVWAGNPARLIRSLSEKEGSD
jgi:acetyltransferase-like isoleucine patch superfamily enzyme